eukprot:565632-Pyramimonas_sp.AAC.1
MIANGVTDEVPMWVREPMTAKDIDTRAASDRRNGRIGRKKGKAVGRSIAMSCLNSLEYAFVKTAPD